LKSHPETLAQLADGTSLRKAKAVIAAWTSGKVIALDALIGDAAKGHSVLSAFTRDALLGKRNLAMTGRIERIMDAGTTPFFCVGCFCWAPMGYRSCLLSAVTESNACSESSASPAEPTRLCRIGL
jgi:hypothetical protein